MDASAEPAGAYQFRRRENWICRAFSAELILPKFEVPRIRPGRSKLGWLVRLNKSERKTSPVRSFRRKRRSTLRSQSEKPGPVITFRPSLPGMLKGPRESKKTGGGLKAAASNQWLGSRRSDGAPDEGSSGFTKRSGRSVPFDPVPLSAVGRIAVSGWPV